MSAELFICCFVFVVVLFRDSGKSVEVAFYLGDSVIGSILHDAYHKFIGGVYTFSCSSTAVASVVKDKIRTQLENIDGLLIRNEYKARIYIDYFLGSLRFLFSVHDLHKRQIDDLDALSHSYLKKWLGLPRGASWALVHDVHGMNVKSISHLYLESRSLTLSNIRFFSDGRVRHALDSKEIVKKDGVANSPLLTTPRVCSRRWSLL